MIESRRNQAFTVRKTALNCVLCSLFLVATLQTVQGRDHLYGALENDDLIACENLYWSGQLFESDNCYRSLTTSAYPPEIRAEAFWALDDLQAANSQFQTAVSTAPDNPLNKIRWGELYIQTFQFGEAYNLFAEALEIDPTNAWAHTGAAMSLVEGGDPELLNSHIGTVMEDALNPAGARLRTMLLVLRGAMQRDQFDKADEAIKEAIELAEDNNLPMMEVNAYAAALAFMKREDYTPWVEASLAESPNYGDAWAIPGYFASITRLYEESGEFYEKAVAIDPRHWRAHVELGQNHLRLNHIDEAIEHVEISYQGDAFNPMTVNLLRLLDTFTEDFVAVSFPDPPVDLIPELTLRLHRDEKDIMENYARKLSEDSIAVFSERYRFEPKEPVIVEIYPNHEDFVVRSIGMPGVGILGVTFGYLFAMDSPSGHPSGESYHWGTTLWHEMAHVFTLKATDNRVPRWFSEGISVFEEWRTGPIPGRKIPTDVLMAMAEGKFMPIAELDDGFMRPTYEGQVMVSYMQGGLVFDFLDLEYGFDSIVDMLYQFNDGVSPVQAIENTLGITAEEFDRHFKQFIDIEFGQLLAGMEVWMHDLNNSIAAYREESWLDAIDAADKAIFTFADYVEPDSPYVIKARAYQELEDEENAFLPLQTFWEKGGYAPRALLDLAKYYVEREQKELAEKVLLDVNYSDPFLEDTHTLLGDLYLETERPAQALEEYMVLLALEPLDQAAVNFRIAKAHHALQDKEKTMEFLFSTLDIAPQYRPAQLLLLELSRSGNNNINNGE